MEQNSNLLTQIEQEKAKVAQSRPQGVFDEQKPKSTIVSKKDEMLDELLNQGVQHQIRESEALQQKVLDTAKTVVDTRMKVVKAEADTEHRKALFDSRKSACECYGFNEETTPTWATKLMSFGYSIMVVLWFIVGTFTFMPIIFIGRKIGVGIKHAWFAFLLATLIYLAVAAIPIIGAWLNG
jgi:hypothetical protein